MKNKNRFSLASFITSIAGFIIAVALLTLTGPGAALAATGTSGGATVYNWVSVTYTSGSYTAPAVYAYNSVTVTTLAAIPTVSIAPATRTVVPAAFVTYSTSITSNANGQDTYSLSYTRTAMPGVSPESGDAFSPVSPIVLWGGTTTSAASGAGPYTISFPGGTLTSGNTNTTCDLVAGTSIVVIAGNQYKVTAISVGAPNTAVSGAASNEVYGVLTVTPIGASPPLTGVNCPIGTTVGEFKKVEFSFTAGTPTIWGTDGSYTHTNTVASATNVAITATTAGVVTTVESPKLTITKRCWAPAGAFANPIVLANYAGSGVSCTAKPGDTIEYLITVTNSNANPLSVASSVNVIDPVPPVYTTYTTTSTYAGNNTTTLTAVPDAGGTSKLTSGNGGYTFPAPIAGNTSGYIVYRVTIQ